MESKSSLNQHIQSDLNGFYHHDHGDAVRPEDITSQQYYENTSRNKSKVYLNDQLIPKPTDINIAEKMIKIATPKEHPYSSHISRFAMFPSFFSPDDAETGVRASSQTFLSHRIPNSAPDVTLLRKTIGGPYRHELMETPIKTNKKAVRWTGDHGFYDLKGEKQVFYPAPPKTVLPNPKLRDWDLSLSNRTSNMLRNLEKTLWITSYQMDYTGSGPANPLKIDDFMEKISDLSAPLRERSYPVFVPSEPKHGWRRRHGRRTCSPTAAANLLNPSSSPKRDSAAATLSQRRPQEIRAKHNEAADLNPKSHSQPESSTIFSAEAQRAESSQEVSHKQQTEDERRENTRVQFDESLRQVSVSQSSREANTAWITSSERVSELNHDLESQREREKTLVQLCDEPNRKKQHFTSESAAADDSDTEILSRAASRSNSCILPRPPVLPGIRPLGTSGSVGRDSAALSLLDLQNSFSKTNAHRNFNSSVTRAAVNLRDNVVTGRKHDFYGVNCYFLHG